MALTLPPITAGEEAALRRLPSPGLHLSNQGGSRLGHRGGTSVEFHEHRPWRAGDEIRRIDWKTTARSREPLLKVTREEREVRSLVALDLSASMTRTVPGAASPRLYDGLRYAQLALHHHHLSGDAVGLASWGDTEPEMLSPGRGMEHRSRLEATLGTWLARLEDPRGPVAETADFPIPPWDLPPTTVHLVGDFEGSGLDRVLRHLRRQGHTVKVVFLLEPNLLHLDFGEARGLTLEDGETGRRVRAPADAAMALRNRVEAHVEDVRRLCRDLGAGFLLWRAGDDALTQYAAGT